LAPGIDRVSHHRGGDQKAQLWIEAAAVRKKAGEANGTCIV
jgi:hypothetical protein